jgi:hypothetical protein
MNHMNTIRVGLSVAVLLGVLAISAGCTRPKVPESTQPSVILQEGSTGPNSSYFTDEKGNIIYNKDPNGNAVEHNPGFPPLFEGAQRIYPADDNPGLRESYLVWVPLDSVKQFYIDRLSQQAPSADVSQPSENKNKVQTIEARDKDGRKQVAIFVNPDEGSNAGMKVMLKDFPSQHAVQIVLTTLEATPTGFDPVGTYISPEEVEKWAKEVNARKAAEQARKDAAMKVADEEAKKKNSGGTGK